MLSLVYSMFLKDRNPERLSERHAPSNISFPYDKRAYVTTYNVVSE